MEYEDEPRFLLITLRHLTHAQAIAKVAKAAGIERESLYPALSIDGNPRHFCFLAGRGTETGDIVASAISSEEWGELK